MSYDCETIAPLLRSYSLVKQCDMVKDGSVRIATPFRYPNGAQIDVFLGLPHGLFEVWELSDKGQTRDYLLDFQIKLWANARRKTLVSDVCNSLGVINDGGVLKIRFKDDDHIKSEISDYLVRLSQACIRITDIAFTQRFRTQGTFADEVEEFIASTELPYTPGFSLPGRFGKQVEFEFMVKGKRLESLIHTVPTQSPATHLPAVDVFTKWFDVSESWKNYQKISIYDSSRGDLLRSDDLQRLSTVSEVVAFPAEEGKLKELLAA